MKRKSLNLLGWLIVALLANESLAGERYTFEFLLNSMNQKIVNVEQKSLAESIIELEITGLRSPSSNHGELPKIKISRPKNSPVTCFAIGDLQGQYALPGEEDADAETFTGSGGGLSEEFYSFTLVDNFVQGMPKRIELSSSIKPDKFLLLQQLRTFLNLLSKKYLFQNIEDAHIVDGLVSVFEVSEPERVFYFLDKSSKLASSVEPLPANDDGSGDVSDDSKTPAPLVARCLVPAARRQAAVPSPVKISPSVSKPMATVTSEDESGREFRLRMQRLAAQQAQLKVFRKNTYFKTIRPVLVHTERDFAEKSMFWIEQKVIQVRRQRMQH